MNKKTIVAIGKIHPDGTTMLQGDVAFLVSKGKSDIPLKVVKGVKLNAEEASSN